MDEENQMDDAMKSYDPVGAEHIPKNSELDLHLQGIAMSVMASASIDVAHDNLRNAFIDGFNNGCRVTIRAALEWGNEADDEVESN